MNYQIHQDNNTAVYAVNGKWGVYGCHNPSGPRKARFGYGYSIINLRSGRMVRIYKSRAEFDSSYKHPLGAEDFPVFGKDLNEVFEYLETEAFRKLFKRCAEAADKVWAA
jgi:hypothetical protein